MILLYGAYGYTGTLIAREAVRRQLPLTLAGRDEARLRTLAGETGLPYRAFPVDSPDLSGVAAVIHAAGPFSRTAAPMLAACLAARVHYLDITGEIPVFEALARRHSEAVDAGICVLPGAGFDVVPSDCLAAHVARRLPGATQLVLALCTSSQLSHGTATTMIEGLGEGGAVRRGGKILRAPVGQEQRSFDFGDRVRPAMTIPWGDVSTAWHSTGIPDIAVYVAAPPMVLAAARWGGSVLPLLGAPWVRRWLQARVDAGAPGPTDSRRERGWSRIVAEARDAEGHTVVSRLLTPEGYTLTAESALVCATRILAGGVAPGFLTPSRAFGPDFVLALSGCERTDA